MTANRAVQRDSMRQPFIPASTLRGVVRESCEKFSRTMNFPHSGDPHDPDINRTGQEPFLPLKDVRSPIYALFGNRYEGGCLFFRDARLESTVHNEAMFQSRICRYRMLGTAKHGRLFSSEYIESLEFATTIDGYHRDLISFDEKDPPFAYCLLIAGLLSVDRLGGDKSIGCGRVSIDIKEARYNDTLFTPEVVFEYLSMPDIYTELLHEREPK